MLLAIGLFISGLTLQAAVPGFDPISGVIRHAQQVASLPNDKIVALSDVDAEDATAPEIVCFNADGTRNAAFSPGDLPFSSISSITPLPSGQILVAGEIVAADGASIIPRLLKLNPDGSVDATFHPGAAYSDSPLVLPEGKVLVLSENDAPDDTALTSLERLNRDGSADRQFRAAVAFDPAREYAVHFQNDGKLLVSSNGDEATSPTLVRLNPDGSADSSFAVPPMRAGAFTSVLPLSDGKVVAAFSGNFNDNNVILRFNSDGTLDATFHPPNSFDDTITTLVALPDGGLIVAGDFRSVDSTACKGVVRLGPDGVLDTAFQPFIGTADTVFDALVKPSGKVLMVLGDEPGAGFTAANSRPMSRHVQGVDDGFAPPPAPAVTIVSQGTDDGFAPPPAPGARIVRGRPVVTVTAARSKVYSGSTEPGRFVFQRTGNRYARRVRVVFVWVARRRRVKITVPRAACASSRRASRLRASISGLWANASARLRMDTSMSRSRLSIASATAEDCRRARRSRSSTRKFHRVTRNNVQLSGKLFVKIDLPAARGIHFPRSEKHALAGTRAHFSEIWSLQ